jgi:hypothetical protein
MLILNISCFLLGQSWSLSYGSWMYSYLCNQWLLPLTLRVRTWKARCTRYNIMWYSLSVICSRSVVSPTNKTDRNDISEILLNTITSLVTCFFFLWRTMGILLGWYTRLKLNSKLTSHTQHSFINKCIYGCVCIPFMFPKDLHY